MLILYSIKKRGISVTFSLRLDTDDASSVSHFCVFLLLFLFFYSITWDVICQWVPCTVHGTHKPLFSQKLSLKIGLTTLFTHLKIILLQCFQFSVFNKISGIQTHPKVKKLEQTFELVRIFLLPFVQSYY